MAAVLAVAVPVSGEGLSAMCAGIGVNSFSRDLLGPFVPPFMPAGIGAELLLLAMRRLLDFFSALLAEGDRKLWRMLASINHRRR